VLLTELQIKDDMRNFVVILEHEKKIHKTNLDILQQNISERLHICSFSCDA
jgi:hypothetical protein